MSRTASAAAVSSLQQQAGKDAFVVLKLTLGTHVYWFADRTLAQGGLNLDGRVENHGNLETQVKVDRSGKAVGTIGTMDFTLLDEDKALLALLNANDFQGATAEVYHWYVGHVQADMILLLKGRIERAPEWMENDRTMKITVETPRRINPIPFAPAESDELDVDLRHLGKTWPMCFGTPSDAPAAPAKSSPRGTLIQDMTQDGQMARVDGVVQDVPTVVFEIENTDEDFPQDTECLVKIADEYVLGSFHGNTLTVSQRQVNHYTGIPITGNGEIVTLPDGVRAAGQWIVVRPDLSVPATQTPVGEVEGASALASYGAYIGVPDPLVTSFSGYCYKQIGNQAYLWNGNANIVLTNVVADVNKYPNLVSEGAKWVHKAGSPVIVASVQPVWIANAIESTSIVRVRAWRQVTKDDHSGYSRRELIVVPPSYYSVNLADSAYNGATTLTFEEDLSARESGWEDDLFVTVESSVGENTADALQYLIDHQSEGKLTSDATSFAGVRAKLINYPSNFAILDQADVLELCGDIAWQARCGIVWNGASAQLKYLSEQPTSAAVYLTDVSVLEGAIKLDSTPIEDVVTVFSVEWRPNYSDPKPQKMLYRNNVARYGKREQKYRFWIYQARKCVTKSATFWSNRYGRIWRCAGAEHWALEGLLADPLDYAGWRISEFLISVYGLVTRSNMNHPATAIEATLPIENGTLTQSAYFWMSDASDTAPAARTYGGASSAEAEIITAPPPDVVALTKPEPQVFNVVAVADEIRDPASSDWKKVQVRILTGAETTATQGVRSNQEQIDTIESLDPGHVNSTLQAQKTELTQANADLTAFIQHFLDHPEIVTANDLTAMYMKSGEVGTMIKIPGGDYIVTPANASGPFIVKVSKKPASPAEGKLYVDFQGSVAHPTVRDTQEINVLGDGSNIQVDDLLLVFRDSLGNYFTPGGGGVSGNHGIARVLATSDNADAIPVYIWLTTDLDRAPDFVTTAKLPGLIAPYKVAEGAYASAQQGTDGEWWLQMVTVQNYVV